MPYVPPAMPSEHLLQLPRPQLPCLQSEAVGITHFLALQFHIPDQTLFVLYRCQHGNHKSEGRRHIQWVLTCTPGLSIHRNESARANYPEQTPLHLLLALIKTLIQDYGIRLGERIYMHPMIYNKTITSVLFSKGSMTKS